jgi:hypothetical protein
MISSILEIILGIRRELRVSPFWPSTDGRQFPVVEILRYAISRKGQAAPALHFVSDELHYFGHDLQHVGAGNEAQRGLGLAGDPDQRLAELVRVTNLIVVAGLEYRLGLRPIIGVVVQIPATVFQRAVVEEVGAEGARFDEG